MGAWGDEVWIICDECGWGALGGQDHIGIDGPNLVVVCLWCFNVPQPPSWTTQRNTRHFLECMKLLPSRLRVPHLADAIGDFLVIFDD
jgi:hypothetical protein